MSGVQTGGSQELASPNKDAGKRKKKELNGIRSSFFNTLGSLKSGEFRGKSVFFLFVVVEDGFGSRMTVVHHIYAAVLWLVCVVICSVNGLICYCRNVGVLEMFCGCSRGALV